MKNIFAALLIFIFVMCFFFIPHGGASQASKIEILLYLDPGILNLEIGPDRSIVLTAQMPLTSSINLNTTNYKNDLLFDRTYANTRPIMTRRTNAPALAQGITVYKATSPRSFHVGK